MTSTEPKPLSDYFKEGMKGRRDGLGLRDNPYCVGSEQRREWNAGYCATATDDDEPAFDDDDRHVPDD